MLTIFRLLCIMLIENYLEYALTFVNNVTRIKTK